MTRNNPEDFIGKRFFRWTVIGTAGRDKRDEPQLMCKCDCGTVKPINLYSLKGNKTKSCGCYRVDFARENNSTHKCKKTRLYRIWTGMKDRCLNPNGKYWEKYGGRGISVFEEWKKFETFKDWALENGYSDELTLERINVNGNYCPENCSWENYETQENNRRNTVYCFYEGEYIPVMVLSRKLNISRWKCVNRYGGTKICQTS